jgi:hypothetical protein
MHHCFASGLLHIIRLENEKSHVLKTKKKTAFITIKNNILFKFSSNRIHNHFNYNSNIIRILFKYNSNIIAIYMNYIRIIFEL